MDNVFACASEISRSDKRVNLDETGESKDDDCGVWMLPGCPVVNYLVADPTAFHGFLKMDAGTFYQLQQQIDILKAL